MKARFLKVTQDGHFFDKHKKVLVALSGGLDSMTLFHLLYDCKEILGIELGIAHVNHQQRVESEEEEAYICQLAKEYQVPAYLSHFTGVFSENAARQWRYDFFKKTMLEEGYTALVTAHHADDQAETVFMRLIRGSRLRHLTAIKTAQPFAGGELIRPLLSFRKSDFQQIFHFEDRSNAHSTYFRNRLRNTYLPQLRQENPQLDTALLHLAQDTETLYGALADLTKDMTVTDLSCFQQQTVAVQTYLLEEYVKEFPDLQLSRGQFTQVLHILQSKANYRQPLRQGYWLEKDYQTFSIKKIQPETDRQIEPFMIESEGVFSYGNYLFSLDLPMDNSEHTLYFPKSAHILLRQRQAGDRLFINGLHKKLRRWFIDEKIPQKARKEAIVVEQEGKIYGIANLVSSDLSKSAKNDIIKAILYIKMKE